MLPLNDELIKRLEKIRDELMLSQKSFRQICNYIECLARDLYLINYSLEDQCSTISRTMSDTWLCQVENQINHNLKHSTVVNKLIQAASSNESLENLQRYFDSIAELDASILDGYAEGKSTRPVDGLMPSVMPADLQNSIEQIELASVNSPSCWKEWSARIKYHIEILNESVKMFPASHSFASLPCSLSIILTQISIAVEEQYKLENLLEVLTSGQDEHDYSSVFGMDVILIKQQLKPVPILAGEDE